MINRIARSIAIGSITLFVVACVDSSLNQSNNQVRRVTRSESTILLDIPGLADGVGGYEYRGWNSNYSAESSYAFVLARNGDPYPRAQVFYTKLSSSYHWIPNTDVLTKATQNFLFFKDKKVNITQQPTSGSREPVQVMRFEVDGAQCVSFSVKYYPAIGSTSDVGNSGAEGIYCGAVGESFGQDRIDAVVEGIYVRAKNGIVRFYDVSRKPIPDRVRSDTGGI
jgi:hypothetical protein